MGNEQVIQHSPSFVCFDDFAVRSLDPIGYLATQSLATHQDPESINLKQFAAVGGLQRALICLLAGNLPFYQARIEELLSQHRIDFGQTINNKPGTPKTLAEELMGLIEPNVGENVVDLPFIIKQRFRTTNFYNHWKGSVAKQTGVGTITWIANNFSFDPDGAENMIGNQLAGSVAAAEFATSLSTYLEKMLYLFPRNQNNSFPEMGDITMLQAVFAAYQNNDEYFPLEAGNTMRDLDADFYATFMNLTFIDQFGQERPVVEHRYRSHPEISLKPEYSEAFRQIVQNKEGILSGQDHLVFVQQRNEKLEAFQNFINIGLGSSSKVYISYSDVKEIFGDEYKNLMDMLWRNGVLTAARGGYVFEGKIFFLAKGNSAFLPDDPVTVVANLEQVLALENDGVIAGEKLQECMDTFLKDHNKKEAIRTVYDSFRYFYFNTVLPEGTMFRLDAEQFEVLTAILEDWEVALQRYEFLISKKGAAELRIFFENAESFGEYLPRMERQDLTHSLLKVLTTKLSMEHRRRVKKTAR